MPTGAGRVAPRVAFPLTRLLRGMLYGASHAASTAFSSRVISDAAVPSMCNAHVSSTPLMTTSTVRASAAVSQSRRGSPAAARRLQIAFLLIGTAGLVYACAAAPAGRTPDGVFSPAASQTWTDINVERINVVEPDGRLKLVISNAARQTPGHIGGQVIPFERPDKAGLVFFSDNGDEVGADRIRGLDDLVGERRRQAIAALQDAGVFGAPRMQLVCTEDGPVGLHLHDGTGSVRVRMQLTGDGDASIEFLDTEVRPVRRVTPGS
jgi:hypothetical protein